MRSAWVSEGHWTFVEPEQVVSIAELHPDDVFHAVAEARRMLVLAMDGELDPTEHLRNGVAPLPAMLSPKQWLVVMAWWSEALCKTLTARSGDSKLLSLWLIGNDQQPIPLNKLPLQYGWALRFLTTAAYGEPQHLAEITQQLFDRSDVHTYVHALKVLVVGHLTCGHLHEYAMVEEHRRSVCRMN